ncbi:MAG: 6-carboxytetrahydropterin synthase [Bacteroidetes bacterium]|nr:6-carboxytetrahydropterin synthase [Bacteroidota bacterium]
MSLIRITKQFTFEMAHVLKGYDGPCRNIHGHSYVLYVTTIGEPVRDRESPKRGMVLDYGDLKNIVKENIVDEFDHALVMSEDHDNKLIDELRDKFERIIIVDYQPTNENLLLDFVQRLKRKLPADIKLHNLKLRETATSYSEWFAEDNMED